MAYISLPTVVISKNLSNHSKQKWSKISLSFKLFFFCFLFVVVFLERGNVLYFFCKGLDLGFFIFVFGEVFIGWIVAV